jgi:hypothetical protein
VEGRGGEGKERDRIKRRMDLTRRREKVRMICDNWDNEDTK